ncbi:MAG: outer membrane lipoprotein carrier protein LolA, partial [Bacteroidota bacterium]|nr:outer membrane lipoprotein carrier protein LolA [Bacteroidota bacterium]MDX5430227.1 outer membrane lipoprotein carrier protein LolA [Bacteroidota bacterium]MDX5468988.1 outer membrane lipoprotein carrier protein LolA [Bacteroidota bacterium]
TRTKFISMFKTIITCTLLLASVVSYGQDNIRKANKILNQVSRSYKTLKSLKASFELQITEPNSKKPTSEKGVLYLKGNSFKVEMATVDIICDGKTQWYYMKDVNEVQITNYDANAQEVSPNTIFTMYDKGFKSIWVEEKNIKGRMVDLIELVPKDGQERKEYTKVKLTIDRVAKEIIHSEIFFRSGRNMKYNVTQQVRNINLAANFFTFDPATKSGITVVDLR